MIKIGYGIEKRYLSGHSIGIDGPLDKFSS